MPKECEILVVGGGPAGLLTASYLGAHHRVALIERGRLGETTKYWLTSQRRLDKHELSECVLHRPSSMVVGTFLGGQLETWGDFVVVNDELLMRVLVDRCRDVGVVLAENSSLVNLKWVNDRIHVETTAGSLTTRLLIDASGARSPIASTFRLHKLYGFFSVYGALLNKIELRSDRIVLAHVEQLGDPPPIIEVFPCGKDSAYCSVFIYTKRLTTPKDLRTLFEQHCANNSFFAISKDTEVVSPKMGAIPIGRIRRNHLAGVVPVGEAGLVQPPLLGSAFNEVLEYSQNVCAHVTKLLSSTSGVPVRPSYRYPLLKRVQDNLQLKLMRALLAGNVEVFDRFIRTVARLPAKTIYDLCSNELTWKQIGQTVIKMPFYLARPN